MFSHTNPIQSPYFPINSQRPTALAFFRGPNMATETTPGISVAASKKP